MPARKRAPSNNPLALVPEPVSYRMTGDAFKPSRTAVQFIHVDEALGASLDAGLSRLLKGLSVRFPQNRWKITTRKDQQAEAAISIKTIPRTTGSARERRQERDESYTLVIGDGVRIEAADAAGLFYGLQTLIQIVEVASASTGLPGLVIRDKPALAWRGMMYDIARDQVINLPYLKSVIAELAHYKMNYFGLYLEHRVVTPSTAETAPAGSLTQKDIRELEDWCRLHFMELIPFTNCLGHMEGFLYHERYQHLSEDPAHPFQICPSNREASDFAAKFLTEMSGMFESPWFHLGGDESWFLGRCPKCKTRAEKSGRGVLFAEHMVRMIKAIKKAGKTPMIWADMLYRQLSPEEYKSILKAIPKDTVLFVWEYRGGAAEPARLLRKKGFTNLVFSPSTNSYCSFFYPDAQNWANTTLLAREAAQLNAWGIFNTAWEMHKGSFFDQTWYPVVLSADTAWHPRHIAPREFDPVFQQRFFGVAGTGAAEFGRVIENDAMLPRFRSNNHLRHAMLRSRVHGIYDVRRFNPEPNPFAPCEGADPVSEREAKAARRGILEAGRLLDSLEKGATRNTEALESWRFALDFARMGLDRVESIDRIRAFYHEAALSQYNDPEDFALAFEGILAELSSWEEAYRVLAEDLKRAGSSRGLGSTDAVIAKAGIREVRRIAGIFRKLSRSRDPIPAFSTVARY